MIHLLQKRDILADAVIYVSASPPVVLENTLFANPAQSRGDCPSKGPPDRTAP